MGPSGALREYYALPPYIRKRATHIVGGCEVVGGNGKRSFHHAANSPLCRAGHKLGVEFPVASRSRTHYPRSHLLAATLPTVLLDRRPRDRTDSSCATVRLYALGLAQGARGARAQEHGGPDVSRPWGRTGAFGPSEHDK